MTALFRPSNTVGFISNGGQLGVIGADPLQVQRMELNHGFNGAQADWAALMD
jgi:hypothetical protein